MYAGLTNLTAASIAAWFIKLLLWVKHRTGIRCRECGAAIPPGDVARFVTDGCLTCGSKKLDYV